MTNAPQKIERSPPQVFNQKSCFFG